MSYVFLALLFYLLPLTVSLRARQSANEAVPIVAMTAVVIALFATLIYFGAAALVGEPSLVDYGRLLLFYVGLAPMAFGLWWLGLRLRNRLVR